MESDAAAAVAAIVPITEVRALLLTDLVDSTRLAATLGDQASTALWAAHDRIARNLLRSFCGQEIDKTDGFLLLFASAADAAGYVLAYHAAILNLDSRLTARAGLHVGPVTLRRNEEADVALGAKPLEVEGIAKPTAARVMSLAIGGQTLLTAQARDALGTSPLRLQSHGFWRMKGLPEPIELFELRGASGAFSCPPDADKAYRVVRQDDTWLPVRRIKHSLPAERDAFVGRQDALRDLARRLEEGARLVSLVGIGGGGKTRLATHFAWNSLGEFPGGVWFCDLAQARDVDGIARAAGAALEVPLGKEDPILQLGNAIAGRGRCLVVLDNFEQVARHSEETLGHWLDRAADARFVVTTRDVLGLAGEQTLWLPPLDANDALGLFVRRCASLQRDFQLSPQDEPVVRQLVKLLDGLPLAIELAAARTRVLAPAALLARMNERFKLLASTGARRDRQATLRATFDWSWEQLSLSDKAALAQLSVFDGGFTLESAEAVLDLTACGEGAWTVESVQSLVDKSFVRKLSDERFDLLVSVKEYAAEHLRTEGRFPGSGAAALAAAEERHGAHFGALGPARIMARQLSETDNLVAACRRAIRRHDIEHLADILEGAWSALRLRGPLALGVELALAALAHPALVGRARARVERVAGNALDASGKRAEAHPHLDAALASARQFGDAACEAQALRDLGFLSETEGRLEEARGYYEAAVALAVRVGDGAVECQARNGLGTVAESRGEMEGASEHFESALKVARRIGDRRLEGRILSNMGILHVERGHVEQARTLYEAALATARDLGDRQWEANTLSNLGLLNQVEGKLAQAREQLEAALPLARELGHPRVESIILCNLGIVSDSEGQRERARCQFEAALTIARGLGDQRSEGQFLTYLALAHAREGRTGEARDCLELGERLLRAVSDRFSLGILLCSRAETECLAGMWQDAETALAAAQALATELGSGPKSELGQAIARVRGVLAASAGSA